MGAEGGTAGAGTPSGAGDALEVEQEKRHARVRVRGEGHVQHGVEPVGAVGFRVEADTRHTLPQPLHHSLLHRADVGFVRLEVAVGAFHCGREPHDAVQVFRAAAHRPLLAAALDGTADAQALADVEEADALRSVEFVGGTGDEVDGQLAEVEAVVPHGLDRVAVEEGAVGPAQRADGFEVLRRGHFVVCVHQAHEGPRPVCKLVREPFEVDGAVGAVRDVLEDHGVAARQRFSGLAHRTVLRG